MTRDELIHRTAQAYLQAIAEGYTARGEPTSNNRSAGGVVARRIGIDNRRVYDLLEVAVEPPFDYQLPGFSPCVKPDSSPPEVGGDQEPPASRLDSARLRAENSSLRAALREMEREALKTEDLRSLIAGFTADPIPPPDWVAAPGSKAAGHTRMILDLGDWHVGERVNPAEVYDKNEFDQDVLDRRVKRIITKLDELCGDYYAKARDGAVVILGGDFVSGWLHEELMKTDWCTPLQAIRIARSRISWLLREVGKRVGKVHVVCVPGNHGRMSKRPPAKLATFESFDWMLYVWLEAEFIGENPSKPLVQGFSFEVPETGEAIVEVSGIRYFVMHGDRLGVKGGDGIIGSLGPIIRGETKIGRQQRSIGRQYDILVLHHFHQTINNRPVIVNNCLIGWNEYAKKERYSFSPPSQLVWFSHPTYGPIGLEELFLEDPTWGRGA